MRRCEVGHRQRERSGAKLQMRPRRGTLLFRTYTPTRWDPDRGVTELIAFTHGEGPAPARREPCTVFGASAANGHTPLVE